MAFSFSGFTQIRAIPTGLIHVGADLAAPERTLATGRNGSKPVVQTTARCMTDIGLERSVGAIA
jgi:hypothetical protein